MYKIIKDLEKPPSLSRAKKFCVCGNAFSLSNPFSSCPLCRRKEWEERQKARGFSDVDIIEKARWSVTELERRELLEIQDGKCAICGKPEELSSRPLHLDHCHTAGTVRGLLCGTCNTGIGMLKDCPEILEAAASYLRHFNTTLDLP